MRTPLYEMHRQLGGRMVEFAGWTMPVLYSSILEEHHATRQHCTVFDTCHMGEFEVVGPGAARYLDRMLTLSVADLAPGRCRYGYLLREDGGVLDDLTCYAVGPNHFWLVVNAGTRASDFAWLQAHMEPEVELHDRSDDTGKLDVQGPESYRVVRALLGDHMPNLRYFHFCDLQWDGVPIRISRTGYTGEWGYEIYVPAERVAALWERLLECGARPAGLGARDTLRLEMGYPLYGHELSVQRTPVAASRGSFVDLRKAFLGRPAVERDLREGCPEYLVGIRWQSRRAARAGGEVRSEGRRVGTVTSGALAPSLGVGVSMAYVESAWARPGVRLESGSEERTIEGEIVSLPFWRNGTARASTPLA